MFSKFTVICFFVKPKLYCFNHSYALQVSFFSLITHVVVTSTFGCVRNFVLIKLHLPMFLKVNWPLPQTVARAICMQKCPGLLLNAHWPDAQRNAWRLRFFQHCACKSAVFAVCLFIIYTLFGCWWSWQHVCDFLSFCFSDKMTTNSCHMKTGNFKLGAKSHSY